MHNKQYGQMLHPFLPFSLFEQVNELMEKKHASQ
jgi:hypothetical protein